MGLGKTLQCIALIHTLLTSPHFSPRRLEISKEVGNANGKGEWNEFRVLVVCPVNVLPNWGLEFEKWTGGGDDGADEEDREGFEKLNVFTLGSSSPNHLSVISQWVREGGVLVTSGPCYLTMMDGNKGSSPTFQQALQNPGPDIVVIDEAHSFLANENNKSYKALSKIKTNYR